MNILLQWQINRAANFHWGAQPGCEPRCRRYGKMLGCSWFPQSPAGEITLEVWRNADYTLGMTPGLHAMWDYTKTQACVEKLEEWGFTWEMELLGAYSDNFKEDKLDQLLGPHGFTLFKIWIIQTNRL